MENKLEVLPTANGWGIYQKDTNNNYAISNYLIFENNNKELVNIICNSFNAWATEIFESAESYIEEELYKKDMDSFEEGRDEGYTNGYYDGAEETKGNLEIKLKDKLLELNKLINESNINFSSRIKELVEELRE